MAPKGITGEGSITNIRWRLVVGVVSLAATVILTFPAGGRAVQQLTADIWPNGSLPDGVVNTLVADIWPNTVIADIWPNGVPVDVTSIDGRTASD